MELLGSKMDLSIDEIYEAASFYSRFRFEPGGKYKVEVCIGTACHVKGAGRIYDTFNKLLQLSDTGKSSPDGLFSLEKTACLGCCMMAPAVRIENSLYGPVKEEDCSDIISSFLKKGEIKKRPNSYLAGSTYTFLRVKPDDISALVRDYAPVRKFKGHISGWFNKLEESFLGRNTSLQDTLSGDSQNTRLATEGAGSHDPLNISEYKEEGGFRALTIAWKSGIEEILDILVKAELRGRGGGGYYTADKWKAVLEHGGRQPYIICNADEGDPGAFMDRMLLESFPFRIIEGVMIAVLTIKAQKIKRCP